MLRFFIVIAVCVLAFSAFAAPAANEPNQTQVAVPAHDIARGAVIAPEDLTSISLPVMRVNDALIRDLSDAIGKETRRALRAGEMIRTSDLKRPTLIAKGSTVTMVFETKGMTLTVLGRALAEGGQGDVIAVLNPTSYRKVEATVVGAGMVRVDAPRLPPATNPNDLAAAQQ